MNTTFERLCAMLMNDHKLPLDRLTLDAPLEGLGINSLGTVELLWNVEDAFNIKLPAELVDLPTLGDVVRYVDERVAGPAVRLAPAVSSVPTGRAS